MFILSFSINKAFLLLFLIPLLLATTTSSMAQEKQVIINGKVTSFEESLPIEGASITVKGTNKSTGTQADGSFTLSISTSDKILIVSYDGYQAQELKLTKATEYDIILKAAGNLYTAYSGERCCVKYISCIF